MRMNNPIRILHVVGIMDAGGAETLIMNLFRNIDRKRIIFDFVVHSQKEGFYDKEILKLGGRIHRVPNFNTKNSINYCISWNTFFKTFKEYRIIHSHVRSTASLFLWIARKHGKHTIIHSHNTSNGKGVNAFIKDFLQIPLKYIADDFFACSRDAGHYLFGEKIMSSNKCEILPNAIDIKKFSYEESGRKKVREELGINDNQLVLGHIGRFEYQKNHDYLIEIFSEVVKNDNKAILLLIGSGSLLDSIKQKVKEKKIEENVRFLGLRADTSSLLKGMDIFLFPSHFEGLPVTLVETQVSDLKCIISDGISNEVDFKMGHIDYISLKKPPEFWANEILNRKNISRNNLEHKFKKYNFNITYLSEWLSEYYIIKQN
ncbi:MULTISPECIES: glycosyltransferase [unclassified Exiguobacterium]|uniref:glycosyltransferase n=1 Tax=unclassified Exiguobacterium TaxID=2644629 RepID=UPI00103FBB4A|nr:MULTISPECIES: glycosyltransferase [unclassified Exiguobacterium]TCI48273.1 glycosyltransferase family 1 protein [Exiguobacterium sp. SH5S32]TCI55159.1 glycosyltransferase family 1 protein [Exiguobacterium sp. SH1S4]TCI74953.1 glycosyltransferase family 1 protein [Exiguobacterium sp. SH1S1]